MDLGTAYIPMDRLQAMARGATLPEYATGTALFADISGFTPLTESLVGLYGAQRGPEELSNYLNVVYELLIAEVHRYGGSVISFAGDAITCWFDSAFDAARSTAIPAERAAICALNMQRAMARFATFTIASGATMSLTIKIAVTSGTVRRFVVGKPSFQQVDILAGNVLMRLAAIEHMAQKGEVLIDQSSAAALSAFAEIGERRALPDALGDCVVLRALEKAVPEAHWPAIATGALDESQIRSWVHPVVYERLKSGKGDFLAELRTAVPLFIRIGDLDYDGDPQAPQKLAVYAEQLLDIVQRYVGALIQLTVGDKGTMIYVAFGAPIAHEDDPLRAVRAALEVRALALDGRPGAAHTQMGISRGQVRTGAYGSATSRTYGVLGDEVNLAARLMQAAAPGQILATQRVRDAAAGDLLWQALPAISVKGKRQPIALYSVSGQSERDAFEPAAAYALPMIGRAAELETIMRLLAVTQTGHGQVIGISGEAGTGKSRLVVEATQRARGMDWLVLSGEAQSFGTQSSYLAWQPIWRALLGVDASSAPEEQLRQIEAALNAIAPALTARAPLAGMAIGTALPDNDLTGALDAKLRKASLEALLVDVLRAAAAKTPLLLVLEDCHWLDPLSADLLATIGNASAGMRVGILLVYRPPQLDWLARLSNFSELRLTIFDMTEARQLLASKALQLFGTEAVLPERLIGQIYERSGGNPFYIDEMLNYLRDQSIDVFEPESTAKLELPGSLQQLILSRIDQLNEEQKATLKVASAIGRLFKAAILWGAFGDSNGALQGQASLDRLASADMLALEQVEPELTYLFKHVMTQEVAYESLPFATRGVLHNKIGAFIERAYAGQLDSLVDTLAFHYDRSPNVAKRREYLLKAGQQSQQRYANANAIDYYQRALPLLSGDQRVDAMLKLGQVLEVVGSWAEATALYREGEIIAAQLGDRLGQARCLTSTGDMLRRQGQFSESGSMLERARGEFEQLDDQAGIARVLHLQGTLASQQGAIDTAREYYERSLTIRQSLDDKLMIGSLLSNLGIVAYQSGDLDKAQGFFQQSLDIRQTTNDRWSVAVSLNNLGNLASERNDPQAAQSYIEQAVTINREIGDRSALAVALNNLGNATRDLGEHDAARGMYREALQINQALDDKRASAYLLEDLGSLAALQTDPERAVRLITAAGALRESIGAPLAAAEQERLNGVLSAARATLGAVNADRIVAESAAWSLDDAIAHALA